MMIKQLSIVVIFDLSTDGIILNVFDHKILGIPGKNTEEIILIDNIS